MKNIVLSVLFLVFSVVGFSAIAGEGHYETRYVNVCVCGGHYERAWNGRLIYYAPRYETRAITVFVRDDGDSGSITYRESFSWDSASVYFNIKW